MSLQINIIGPLIESDYLHKKHIKHIFVDGGVRAMQDKINAIVVGDGDSCQPEQLIQFDHLYPREKEFSDIKLALNHLEKDATEIHLYGLWGGDLDHQLSLFGEIYHYLKCCSTHKKFFLHGKTHQMALMSNKSPLRLEIQGSFSILNFEQNKLTISGQAQYLMEPSTISYPFSSQTIRNRANGLVEITSQHPVLIIADSKARLAPQQ